MHLSYFWSLLTVTIIFQINHNQKQHQHQQQKNPLLLNLHRQNLVSHLEKGALTAKTTLPPKSNKTKNSQVQIRGQAEGSVQGVSWRNQNDYKYCLNAVLLLIFCMVSHCKKSVHKWNNVVRLRCIIQLK